MHLALSAKLKITIQVEHIPSDRLLDRESEWSASETDGLGSKESCHTGSAASSNMVQLLYG
jgi:hypothetical protein